MKSLHSAFPSLPRTPSCFIAVLTLLAGSHQLNGQGTAFTYQGTLNNNGGPASGNFDFVFALYNQAQAGAPAGPAETNSGVPVTEGVFTTTLDFSSAPWNGQPLWLQVLVRTNGGGPFVSLSPRQPLTSVPYAIQSLNAATADSVSAANLIGTIPLSALPASPVFTGQIAGNGGGLTNLNPISLDPGTAAINISGNAATATSAATVTGNIADFQLSANVPFLDGTNSFIGSNNFAGVTVATNTNNFFQGTFMGNYSGNGSGLTNVNAATLGGSITSDSFSALSSGLSAESSRAETAEGTLTTGQDNLLSSLAAETNRAESAESVLTVNLNNEISRALTAENALATNMAQLNGTNVLAGTNIFSGTVIATNSNNVINGTFGGALYGLATTALTANNFVGALGGDVTGTQSFTVVASVGGQSAASVAAGASAANAATSANTANTIVARDASGNFAAGTITANFFNGNGGGLTNLSPGSLDAGTAAINISGNAATATTAANVTGNIADFQLSANIPLLDGTNSFTATNNFAGVTVATNVNNVFEGSFVGDLSGNGGGLTNVNAASLGGAVTADSFSALSGGLSAETSRAETAEGTLATGQDNLLSRLIAETNRAEAAESVLTAGLNNEIGRATTAENALSTSMARLNGTNAFTGTNSFAGVTLATNTGNIIDGTFTGNLTGNATTAGSATVATTALTANNFSGSLSGDVLGTQRATTVATVGGQSAASVAAGAGAANAATSANTASTIVKRDASGNFSAGTITATSYGGIYGATTAGGVAVYVNSAGQLGTLTSSQKYKRDIRNMGEASDALLELRPVTFRYKPELDPAGLPQFGLVAEEVEKVNPGLVAHDDHGRPYTVRYEAVNAMLLNEFLKEHRQVETQTAKIEELTRRLERLEKTVSETSPTQ
jgi:hypothetical protein